MIFLFYQKFITTFWAVFRMPVFAFNNKHEIFGSIVVPNSVNMMHFFVRFKIAAKKLLHYQTMLINIFVFFLSKWMRMAFYQSITSEFILATFPATVFFTFGRSIVSFLKFCLGRNSYTFSVFCVAFMRTVFSVFPSERLIAEMTSFCYGWFRHILFLKKRVCLEPICWHVPAVGLFYNRQFLRPCQ